jgi:hypothetical protein
LDASPTPSSKGEGIVSYLYNPNGNLTVMHLAEYDRLGAQIGALCGERDFSRSINITLGASVCSRCSEIAHEIQSAKTAKEG